MPDTGFAVPGTTTDASGVGSVAWTNTGNVTVSDNVYTQAGLSFASNTSHWLRLTNFNFSIPSGSNILGVEVNVERKRLSLVVLDNSIRLRITSGQVGDDKADTVTNWPATDTVKTYGGAADDWNAGLTRDDVVSSDFGIDISCKTTNSGTPSIDYVEIKVYYATPTVLTPAAATATLTAQAASLKLTLLPGAISSTVTAQTAGITTVLNPIEATLSLVGESAVIITNGVVTYIPGTATLTITGNSAILLETIYPGAASLALTGQTPAVYEAELLLPGAGGLTLTAQTPAIFTSHPSLFSAATGRGRYSPNLIGRGTTNG